MAYMVSETSPAAFNNEVELPAEKMNQHKQQPGMQQLNSAVITSQLHLRPETLDKDIILRRIQTHKCVYKVKGALRAMLMSSSSLSQTNDWLEDQQDAFSSP